MEILYDLKDLICEELDKINKKHDINPGELEMAYKAVDIIKDITTIEAMEEYGDEYSYDDDMSYARNRDSMGRYSSRRGRRSYDGGNYSNRRSYNDRMQMDGGYSGAESKEEMMRKIDEMQRKLQQM
jgi:hypothetical protein